LANAVTVNNTTVAEVLPSYYWPQNAVVIVTACGHRHVRPIRPVTTVGDKFLCPFCLDNAPGAGEPMSAIPTPGPWRVEGVEVYGDI